MTVTVVIECCGTRIEITEKSEQAELGSDAGATMLARVIHRTRAVVDAL